MKILISILFLLFCLNAFAQTEKKTIIKFKEERHRKSKGCYFYGVDSLFFYKLPEDTLMFSIEMPPFVVFEFPTQHKNIPTSDYILSYKNKFRQEINKKIHLIENDSNIVNICFHNLIDYPQNTLKKLHNGDSITISYAYYSCHGVYDHKLIITKKDNNFIANLYGVSVIGQEEKLLNSKILTDSDIVDFICFENELNFAREDGGCSASELYWVKSKYLNISKTDNTCNWRGFDCLMRSFFPKKK